VPATTTATATVTTTKVAAAMATGNVTSIKVAAKEPQVAPAGIRISSKTPNTSLGVIELTTRVVMVSSSSRTKEVFAKVEEAEDHNSTATTNLSSIQARENNTRNLELNSIRTQHQLTKINPSASPLTNQLSQVSEVSLFQCNKSCL